jgi:hypothetical protein
MTLGSIPVFKGETVGRVGLAAASGVMLLISGANGSPSLAFVLVSLVFVSAVVVLLVRCNRVDRRDGLVGVLAFFDTARGFVAVVVVVSAVDADAAAGAFVAFVFDFLFLLPYPPDRRLRVDVAEDDWDSDCVEVDDAVLASPVIVVSLIADD